uniref:NADH-ubiquinone oxidoreductase chain 6 n=1 Tax=Scolytinae sp. BMNH 1043123 TaxID=1903797 RepID=A0A343A5B6_9CUCU|nr:NADH dehydrogenase subunit 6 [Scolytinae sp. BMNH 1043123]
MFLLISMFLFSTLFMFLKHPLTMGGILLTNTILSSMISGLLSYNFWFSYILFLIMVGGMMIMFMYMTSIASNEKFSTPNMKFITFVIIMIMLFIWMVTDSFLFTSLQMMNLNFQLMNDQMLIYSLNKFFNWPNYILSLMLMLYLLLTLISIVKIIDRKMGPLRQK